ncbi:MAG: class I SAM-dependent methyltransferase [Nitrosospira sp.]|nr:class I SAM-dependent methyltransferase [Nitrosospira sp.]
MIKYFVLENYIRRLEYFLWARNYDPSRTQIEEDSKFVQSGLDYACGSAKLERLLKELERHLNSDDQSMRSIHWILFACLSEHSPIPIRRILEIGTFDGETTFILSKLFPTSEIVTVELPEDDPIFHSSYARDDVQTLNDFKTRQSANLKADNIIHKGINSFFLPGKIEGGFDLIWVDGGHLYPEVAWDICNAYHFCSPGGFIMVDDVITHHRGFRDAYVSPDSHQVLEYVATRTHETPIYFLKRNSTQWSAIPRRRKFVALLRKTAG